MFIRQLVYVTALAREKHFGRAAASCNVSQPALSGAIQKLEEELGFIIVRRGKRFEGFTEDGKRAVTLAQKILADFEALYQLSNSSKGGPIGTLKMGVIPTALPLVQALTHSSLEKHPYIRYEIYALSADEIVQKVHSFELDIGLSYLDDEKLNNLTAIQIFRERYILLAKNSTMFDGKASISWSDVAKLPLCLFTSNLECRKGIDAEFNKFGVNVRPQLEANSMIALCQYVSQSRLYSIMPHSVLSQTDGVTELSSLPILPYLYRDIGLIFRRQQPYSMLLDTALNCFIDLNIQTLMDRFLPSY